MFMVNIRKLESELWESADLLRAGAKLTFNQYSVVKEQVTLLVPTEKGTLGGVFQKMFISPHLFPLGNPFWSGVLRKFVCENIKATHRLGTWLKLPDRQ